MRMTQIPLYQYNELDERSQARAIDALRDINVEHDWYECTIDLWVNLLDSIGFTDAKIQFSGFCSQGDGASFVSGVDFDRLTKIIATNPDPSSSLGEESKPELASYVAHKLDGFPGVDGWLWNWLASIELEPYFSVVVQRSSSHYSHGKTCSVEISDYLGYKYSTEWSSKLREIEEDIDTLRYQMCQCIFIDLRTEYEHLTDDQTIIETIEANGYEFYNNGKQA